MKLDAHVKTLTFAVSFFIGIYAGFSSYHSTELAVCALLIFILQLCIYRISFSSLSLMSIFVSVGILFGIIRTQFYSPPTIFLCKQCVFMGTVVSHEQKDLYQEVVVSINHSEDVLLRTSLYPIFPVGAALSITGTVDMPKNATSTFDYISYLHTKGIGSLSYFPTITVVDDKPHTVILSLRQMKEYLVSRLNKYISFPEAYLATGMLFGENGMPGSLLTLFRTSGLSHIIVLSGFNIAVIISFILLLCSFFPLYIRVASAFGAVIVFVLMVGIEPSVLRATVMASIALLATVSGRAYVAKQALIISLFLIALHNPYAILHDVSLHLSFLATAGIIYFGEDLTIFFLSKRISLFFAEVGATTIAAYLGTLPYVLHVFGSFAVYALLANMIIVPLVPISMGLTFAVVALSFVSNSASLVIGFITSFLLRFIITIAKVVGSLPHAYLPLHLSFLGMVVWYVIFVSLYFYFTTKKNEMRVTDGSVYIDETVYRY